MARNKTKAEREEEKLRIAVMVVGHFDTTYGRNVSRLQAWQDLCRDVGVGIGGSIDQCQRVGPKHTPSPESFNSLTHRYQNLKGIYINIVDYVNAKQHGTDVRRFSSPKALSNYIRNNPAKMFPRDEAKKNPILRWMLIHLC